MSDTPDTSAAAGDGAVPRLTRRQRQIMLRMLNEGLELMSEPDGSCWLYDTSRGPMAWKTVERVSTVTAERLIVRGLAGCCLTARGRAALGVGGGRRSVRSADPAAGGEAGAP